MRSSGRSVKATGMVLVLAALTGGCASIKDHRGYMVDQTLVQSVQPGVDNRESVEKALGRPTFVSQFGEKDYYYVSQVVKTPAFGRPRTESQTVLKVTFDPSGNVASIKKTGMEDVVRLRPDGDTTPTLGRHRGLLQDLFGNIGQVGAAGMGTGQTTPQGSGPNGS